MSNLWGSVPVQRFFKDVPRDDWQMHPNNVVVFRRAELSEKEQKSYPHKLWIVFGLKALFIVWDCAFCSISDRNFTPLLSPRF